MNRELATLIKNEEKRWNEEIRVYAEQQADLQDFSPLVSPFNSLKVVRGRFIQSILETMSFEKCGGVPLRAYLTIQSELRLVIHSEEEAASIQQNLQEGFEKFLTADKTDEEKSPAELMELSDEAMGAFYTLAGKLLEEKRISEYGDIALFLFQLDPYVSAYAIAVGIFYQEQSLFQDALTYYEYAEEIAPENGYGYLYSARCCHAMHCSTAACAHLEKLLQLKGRDQELLDLQDTARDELMRFRG